MLDVIFNETDAKKIYENLILSLEEYIKEPLYPGDERRIFSDALALVFIALYMTMNETAKQKMLRYASGAILDALGERTGTPRLEPKSAQTMIRFTVSEPQIFNIIIPKSTRVATIDGNIVFTTDEAEVLDAGGEYIEVPASSISHGSALNGFPAGSLVSLVDLIPFIAKVENIKTTFSGDDGEPYSIEGDSRYRERIRLAPASFSVAGPSGAYRYYALTADSDIIDVDVDSPEPGVVQITPLMIGGTLPDENVKDTILTALNDKRIRPQTDYVTVATPTQIPFDIELVYYMDMLDEVDVVQTVEGESGAIERYIAWQMEKLGRDINPDELRKYILAPDWANGLKGAVRVDVTAPSFIAVGNTEVGQFSGNLVVSHHAIVGGATYAAK